MDRHDKDFLALLLLAVVFTAGGLNGMRVGMSDWSWLLAAAGLFIGAYAYVKWQAARRGSVRTSEQAEPDRERKDV